MSIEIKKTKVKRTKFLYLGMSILDVSKIFMYESWYDYISPKYGDRAKLWSMGNDSFFIYIKTEDFFEDIFNDIERWFDTLNYDKNDRRPLPIRKNKKVSGLFKDELGGKIMTEVVAPRPKAYSYIDDDGSEQKKSKGIKKCVIKQKFMFQNWKNCLLNNKTVYRSQKIFKSYNHDVYTEEVNKITLSSDDDQRLQTFDMIETYSYGTRLKCAKVK